MTTTTFTNYPARNGEIYRAREKGETLTSIAKKLGLSPNRVGQIYYRQVHMRRRIEERLNKPLRGR